MSRAIRSRLSRIETRTPEGFDVDRMTDEQLFMAFRRLIDRDGGIDAVCARLEAEGESEDVALYRSMYACKTAAEFMAASLPHTQNPRQDADG